MVDFLDKGASDQMLMARSVRRVDLSDNSLQLPLPQVITTPIIIIFIIMTTMTLTIMTLINIMKVFTSCWPFPT